MFRTSLLHPQEDRLCMLYSMFYMHWCVLSGGWGGVFETTLILSSCLRLGLSSSVFPSGFPTKALYVYVPIRE
jgi:hypothetical protein